MQTPLPPSVSGPLLIYQTQDGSIWAANPASGFGLQIAPPEGSISAPPPTAGGGGGVPEAPVDGQQYARQSEGWSVVSHPLGPLHIDQIQPPNAVESSTVNIQVSGAGFSPQSQITWGGYPLTTTFVDAGNLTASVTLGPGSGGVYAVIVTDPIGNSNSVAFQVLAAVRVFSTQNAVDNLAIDANGDLIITQQTGPNAGKTVNLTYGKWQ
jgi:IPT/TIG domain